MEFELDEFGNPIQPAPTPIEQSPADPASSGVNGVLGVPPPQDPPWMRAETQGHPANDQAGPPPEQRGVLSLPLGQVGGEPPPPQRPPWLQALNDMGRQATAPPEPTALSVDAISGGQMPSEDQSRMPPSGISREPSLAERENRNIMEMGGIQEAKAQQKDYLTGQGLVEQEALDFAHQKRKADRDAKIAAKVEQHQADVDAYANGRVDPERWSDRQGFGATVLYGVTAFLSGLANPRGPNKMVEWIGQQIERDLEAQRAELQAKGNALGMKRNALAMEIEAAGDQAAGEASFRAKRWALTQQKIAAVDQSFADEEARVNTQQALVETRKQQLAAEAEFGLKVAKLTVEEEDRMMQRQIEAEKLRLQDADSRRDAHVQMRGQDISVHNNNVDNETARMMANAEAKRKEFETNRESAVAHPGNAKVIGRFTVGKPEEWVKARAAGETYHKGKAAYDEYIALVKKGVKTPLNHEELARARAAHKAIIANWKSSEQMGAYDKGLAALADEAIPPPIIIGGKSWFDMPGQAIDAALAAPTLALQDNVRRLDTDIDAKYNSLGYESIDGTPFSGTYAKRKDGATEGEGPAARASKVVPVEKEKGRSGTNTTALPAPRIGR